MISDIVDHKAAPSGPADSGAAGTPSRRMELTANDFAHCLEELRPKVGSYGWAIAILRFYARWKGHFPMKMHSYLARFTNAKKPYFIGKTRDGIRFMGDFRDGWAVHFSVCSAHAQLAVRFARQRADRFDGDYLAVGVNIGVTTAAIASSLRPGSELIAFEASVETARCAAATFALNGLRNIRLFLCAVSDRDGEVAFFEAPGRSERATASRRAHHDTIHWVETKVPCRSLDSLATDGVIGRVGLMTLGVEGHEYHLMRGARKLIADQAPPIIYRYDSWVAPLLGWHAGDVAELLNGVSTYHCHVIQADSTLSEFRPGIDDEHRIPGADAAGVFDIFCESPTTVNE